MSNIEKIFKTSLENHEVPYDGAAWEKLSKKLDDTARKDKKSKSTTTWIIVSSIVVLSSSLLLINNSAETSTKKINKINNEIKDESLIRSSNEKVIENKLIVTKHKKTESESKANVISKKIEFNIPTPNDKPANELNKIELKTPSETTNNARKNSEKTTITFTASAKEFYCLGETEELTNENNYPIYLISDSKKTIHFKSSERIKITFKEVGNYYWSREPHLNTKEKMHAFYVKENPTAQLNIPTELDYSNGLPQLSLTSSAQHCNVKWYINQKPSSTEKDLDLALFNKGNYSFTLVAQNNFGCTVEINKNFLVEENYNLLSVTGFEPSNPDPKRNTFLPYALTVRNTPFRMLIIDPKTSQIIYETTDKNKPWNGVDQKTDELVPENSDYIWKVTLFNPENNEKSEYRGKITRI